MGTERLILHGSFVYLFLPPRSREYIQHDGLLVATATQNMCARAIQLSTSVAIDCGSHQSEQGCCFILRQAVLPEKPLMCLCTLAGSESIVEVGLTIRDLVSVYATCNSIRPGDLHLPSGGCAEGKFHILLAIQSTFFCLLTYSYNINLCS